MQQDTENSPVAIHKELLWLPAGSLAEVWLDANPVPEQLSTSAFALAFMDDGRQLLANVRKRGADIPGGHIEPGEDAMAAASRETKEETGARIRLLGKVGHLRLFVPNPPPGYRYPAPYSFQPFYLARVEALGPVEMTEECDEPVLADPFEMANSPRFHLHRPLILAATAMFQSMHTSAPTAR